MSCHHALSVFWSPWHFTYHVSTLYYFLLYLIFKDHNSEIL
jgi:hypothetical protein